MATRKQKIDRIKAAKQELFDACDDLGEWDDPPPVIVSTYIRLKRWMRGSRTDRPARPRSGRG